MTPRRQSYASIASSRKKKLDQAVATISPADGDLDTKLEYSFSEMK